MSIKRFASSSTTLIGLIARRDPLLTKQPTPFQEAYYDYKDCLQRTNARPFQKEFYFKKGTPPELVWDTAAQDPESLFKLGGLSKVVALQSEELKQVTFVDYLQDTTLDYSDFKRMKRDTVYYFVKQNGKWVLPSSSVVDEELMHDVADRVGKEGGLDHHVIGRVCVGMNGDTFYMKSRMWNSGKTSEDKEQVGYFTKQEIIELNLLDESLVNIID